MSGMKEPGIRYSIVTTEDIENLADKWKCGKSSFSIHNVSGQLEIRVLTAEMPNGASAILRNVARLRIAHRTAENLGDLLVSDLFPGSTVEIDFMSSSDPSTEYEVLSYLEIFTGLSLRGSHKNNPLINIHDHQVFRSVDAQPEQLHTYIMSQLTDVSSVNDLNIGLTELLYDAEDKQIKLRLVSSLPQDLHIEINEASLPSEVGLLQRQKRTLQDSEFKGLSAFLPAQDLSPFMVFFDQRLRPHTRREASVESRIRGTGSHLMLEVVPRYGNVNTTRNLSSKGCVPYIMAELPRSHFFDIYELENLEQIVNPRVFGEQDLEQPIWSALGWGSVLLAEFRMQGPENDVQIPFHARYLHPTLGQSATSALILAPQVFYACPLQDAAFEDNPWNTYTLKEDLIGQNHLLRFYDNGGPRNFTLEASAADASNTTAVLSMTMLTILIGFVYVVSRLSLSRSPRLEVIKPSEKHVDS